MTRHVTLLSTVRPIYQICRICILKNGNRTNRNSANMSGNGACICLFDPTEADPEDFETRTALKSEAVASHRII